MILRHFGLKLGVQLVFICACACDAVSLNFVNMPLGDVAKAVSRAYETDILVDDSLDLKVSMRLEGVGLLEGMAELCQAYGLSLVQEDRGYRIRRTSRRGENDFKSRDSLISISVKDKDLRDFVHEFSLNSGLNILVSPEVSGTVSGELRNLPARTAFVNLMKSCGFRVRERGGCLFVEKQGSDLPKGIFKADDMSIEKRFEGDAVQKLFSVHIRDVPLAAVLQELAETAELNLAVYGDVHENVQLDFDTVSLQDLLEALFKGRRYSYVLQSGTLFVSEGGTGHALSTTALYPLKHSNASLALGYLGKFSPSASFVATEVKEQNALLLGGSQGEIQMAQALLELIDVPSLQVTLSCIIVELKRGDDFEIGLHGGIGRKTGELNVGARGYFDFLGSDISSTGPFGKVGLLPDRFEMELASLEEENRGEVLARPRLTTLNGNKAELNVTNTVYYLVSQVSADGYPITDYRSFNDGISLELTPTVTRDGNITLEVSPEIKTAGRSSGDGPRDISTRNLKTVVVLKDGETLCLGGLIRKNQSEVRSAVPFLGSIPLIGRLFSYTSQVEEVNELAIFITPRVEPDHGSLLKRSERTLEEVRHGW